MNAITSLNTASRIAIIIRFSWTTEHTQYVLLTDEAIKHISVNPEDQIWQAAIVSENDNRVILRNGKEATGGEVRKAKLAIPKEHCKSEFKFKLGIKRWFREKWNHKISITDWPAELAYDDHGRPTIEFNVPISKQNPIPELHPLTVQLGQLNIATIATEAEEFARRYFPNSPEARIGVAACIQWLKDTIGLS